MDFTLEKYKALLEALKRHGHYAIRHDVDLRPSFALRVAKIESAQGMHATYYFRTIPGCYDEELIREIAALGHRIGYHYENMTTCNGDIEAAYLDFVQNLERLRRITPITTACAHGSPRSKWNSMDIWKCHDIRALGIEYEPMLDTDFSSTVYLTDTGRRWDGYRFSVRDKVPQYQRLWVEQGLVFHGTEDIIKAINTVENPIHKRDILINTHPQRWMPFGIGWIREAWMQKAKNIVKYIIVSVR